MKVKVIEAFFDLHTGEFHQCGDIMDVTEERRAEIEKNHHYVDIVIPKEGTDHGEN